MNITEYTIELLDIHIYAYHGVMQQEREIGAWFTINLKLTLDSLGSADSDNIENTVSYADVYEVVCHEMKTTSNLLEHVCKRVSRTLYDKFEQIKEIEINLCKDTPPMGGDRLKAAVTLKSRR